MHLKPKLTIAIISFLCLISTKNFTQENNDNKVTHQFWFDFKPSHKISEKAGVYMVPLDIGLFHLTHGTGIGLSKQTLFLLKDSINNS